jgi:hypothetical protein
LQHQRRLGLTTRFLPAPLNLASRRDRPLAARPQVSPPECV